MGTKTRNCYEKLGIQTLINASETYTNLGGSLMEPETVKAMQEAGRHFVDYGKLLDAVCRRCAMLTNNEAAFVTTGAAAGLELAAAACMCEDKIENIEKLPDTRNFKKNEILILDGKVLNIIPYWKLIGLTGAKIIKVKPDIGSLKEAINEKTAACVFFPASLYEKDIPKCEELIPEVKKLGVKVIVDAAAQLPPASNLWYYTKTLGADLTIFSGGKHIKGPQCTGLMVGDKHLLSICQMLASPNERLGRGFKTGKEELVGFVTALELFVTADDRERFDRQKRQLEKIEELLKKAFSTGGFPIGKISIGEFSVEENSIGIRQQEEGRLGTYQPLLLIALPRGLKAKECNEYTRTLEPAVDIGVYQPEFEMPENVIFLNAYNLKDGEEITVANAVIGYIKKSIDI